MSDPGANRRLIAERLGWPTGAVEACEWIEAAAPGWHAAWSHGDGQEWDRPGYYAERRDWHRLDPGPRWVYGETPDELLAEIEAVPVVRRGLDEYRPLDLPGGD